MNLFQIQALEGTLHNTFTHLEEARGEPKEAMVYCKNWGHVLGLVAPISWQPKMLLLSYQLC